MTYRNTEKKIIVAIPKGRILEELTPLLNKVDIIPEKEFFDLNSRKILFSSNKKLINFIKVRSFDVVNLGIGSCRLSVAEPFKMALKDDPKAWTHLKIATKYPKITKKHFALRGVQAECLKLNGALEIAPKLELSSRIVDLVSTGKTLKENGLIEVEKIMDITSYLIVNKNMAKTYPNRIRKIISNFRKAVNA